MHDSYYLTRYYSLCNRVLVTEPMNKINIIHRSDSYFYGDTTQDFFDSASASEYKEFHDNLRDVCRNTLGIRLALNHPIHISILDRYKGMLTVMGIKFDEIKQH